MLDLPEALEEVRVANCLNVSAIGIPALNSLFISTMFWLVGVAIVVTRDFNITVQNLANGHQMRPKSLLGCAAAPKSKNQARESSKRAPRAVVKTFWSHAGGLLGAILESCWVPVATGFHVLLRRNLQEIL